VRRVPIEGFRGRLLKPGVRFEIFVARPEQIGKIHAVHDPSRPFIAARRQLLAPERCLGTVSRVDEVSPGPSRRYRRWLTAIDES